MKKKVMKEHIGPKIVTTTPNNSIILFRNKLDEEAETKMAEDMLKEGYEPKLGPVEISFLLRMMVAKAPESKFENWRKSSFIRYSESTIGNQ